MMKLQRPSRYAITTESHTASVAILHPFILSPIYFIIFGFPCLAHVVLFLAIRLLVFLIQRTWFIATDYGIAPRVHSFVHILNSSFFRESDCVLFIV